MHPVRVSAKTDYALRAVAEIAAADAEGPVKGERIATAQDIPLRFLENILSELRNAGIVQSRRVLFTWSVTTWKAKASSGSSWKLPGTISSNSSG